MYTIFLYSYFISIKIASFFYPKAKQWLNGRVEASERLKKFQAKNCIWFHTSSLGEFEQVSYLIEQIKKNFPKEKILVTFFSPSGYEIKKNFPFADEVLYLPFDFKEDIKTFVQTIEPKLVFWVRYEFWLNVLTVLKQNNIPVFLLNGVFRNQISKVYKPILQKCLANFKEIYVISKLSQDNLRILGFDSKICYDTRYDRMHQIANQSFHDDVIEKFIEDRQVVVCGSIWSSDDEILSNAINQYRHLKWILIPHEVHLKRIQDLTKKFPDAELYSNGLKNKYGHILVIDKIGILSKLYRKADVAYVGGGFEKVVHSLVEPMAYAIPILIGKNIEKSEEAKEYVEKRLVVQVEHSSDVLLKLQELIAQKSEENYLLRRQFFESRLHAVDNILSIVKKNIEI